MGSQALSPLEEEGVNRICRPSLQMKTLVNEEQTATAESSNLQVTETNVSAIGLVKSLSILDRFLAPLVLLVMILGIVIGIYAPNVQSVLNGATLASTSIPLVVGMIIMMWPALTKVEYERIPKMFSSRKVLEQIVVSLVINWVVGPFIMLGCAWATLPDLPTYRTGVIMVGLARCIAMVMIWNQLAGGDSNLCAIIVIINSVLQIVLYSPMAVFFIRVISGEGQLGLEYGKAAIAVLVFLGIPLGLGMITRLVLLSLLGKDRFSTFLRFFSPLALVALLYTIIIIFAQQARQILHNLGPVFRVIVPLVLYFTIMFSATFLGMWMWSRSRRRSRSRSRNSSRSRGGRKGELVEVGYQEAAVQSFTAASNNFELSIAVCVAVFGVDSDQALAATIGPLVEVPVLVSLTWVSLFLGRRLQWGHKSQDQDDSEGGGHGERPMNANGNEVELSYQLTKEDLESRDK